ncbi:MAG TPA: CoA transferase [Salinarimonas sp.]|nr:CoA transferase [Salinarimonas sp.]
MPGALEGCLVVAIEQAVAAPMCTQRLADAGARVIKIERPEGDTARHYDQAAKGVSAYFAWLNRGKESAVLDLKDAGDLALAHRLIAHADVLVQNLAPGAAERLGLGSAALTARHPRLIAVDVVGYGSDTPAREMRAYDMLVQAEAGICAVTGTADEPVKVGVSIADIATGMNAHAAILEALIARGVTGRGRAIEIAMFDGMADWMTVPLLHLTEGGRATARHGLSHASIYPYSRYACVDGDIVMAVQHQGEWTRFCAGVLGRPELAGDPRFRGNAARVANREALDALIAPAFAALTQAAAIVSLESHGIAWARVSTVEDLARHPALRLIESPLPGDGRVAVPRPAGRDAFLPGPVPGLGEHTSAIRAEFA